MGKIDEKHFFKCDVCGKGFSKKSDLYRTFSGAEVCTNCISGLIVPARVEWLSNFKKIRKSKGTVKCGLCSSEVAKDIAFLEFPHYSVPDYLREDASGEQYGFCPECIAKYMEDAYANLLGVPDDKMEEARKNRKEFCKEMLDYAHGKSVDVPPETRESDVKAPEPRDSTTEEKDITDFNKEELYPDKIKAYLDRFVIGQESAKKVLSVAAYNHYKRLKIGNPMIGKNNILLIGPTGCGKTHLVKTLAKALKVPVAMCQATSLTEAGYVGQDPSSVVERLYSMSGKDAERTEKGIIFIDEVDKLAGNAVKREVGGQGVQQALLTIMEGAPISLGDHHWSKHPIIDTSNILFIFGGAFPALEEIVSERVRAESGVSLDNDVLSHVRNEDFIKFGMIPEFMGRIPTVAALEDMRVESLRKILTEPDDALISQYKEMFMFDGTELSFTDDALDRIAELALEEHTGARALRTIVENVMLDAQFVMPSKHAKYCTVTRAGVDGERGGIVFSDKPYSADKHWFK